MLFRSLVVLRLAKTVENATDYSIMSVRELGEQARKFMATGRQRPELGNLFTSFDPNYPQVKVDLDREKARTLGVPVNEAFQAMSAAMAAYEAMIRNTATRRAPWYVVPADNKWFTRVIVAAAIIDALASLDLAYPEVGKSKLEELAATKRLLEAEEIRLPSAAS